MSEATEKAYDFANIGNIVGTVESITNGKEDGFKDIVFDKKIKHEDGKTELKKTAAITGTLAVRVGDCTHYIKIFQNKYTKDGKDAKAYGMLVGLEVGDKIKITRVKLSPNEYYNSELELRTGIQHELVYNSQITMAGEKDAEEGRSVLECVVLSEPIEDEHSGKTYITVGIVGYRGAITPIRLGSTEKVASSLSSVDLHETRKFTVGKVNKQVATAQECESFGDDIDLAEFESGGQEYVITGGSAQPIDEKELSPEEIAYGLKLHQDYLANLREKQEEYLANKGNQAGKPKTTVKVDKTKMDF